MRRCEPGPPAAGGAPEPPVGAAKGKGAAGPSLSGHGSRAPGEADDVATEMPSGGVEGAAWLPLAPFAED